MMGQRNGYSARGLVTGGALMAIGAAAVLFGASKCDDTLGAAQDALHIDGKSAYERTIENYDKLSADDRFKFFDQKWDTLPTDDKRKIIGDDLGIRVSDLYQAVK